MTRIIVLSRLSNYSVDYSKVFDKLKMALSIIVVFLFMFSYLRFSKMYMQEYDELLKKLHASGLKV